MKRFLMIANEFPPIGGSGVQRSVKFAKYLPAAGYEPVVVCKAYSGGLKDETLLKDLPKTIKRYDLKSVDWVDAKGFIGKVKRAIGTRILTPDAEVIWYLQHRKTVLKILDQHDIKLVYSTSYPYSDHLMAAYIKKKRPDVKWVVDFRDEWTNNPYFKEKWWMRLRYPFERRMETMIVNSCNYLVTNTPFMLANFLKDTPSLADRSAFIPNGFDHDDFSEYQVSNQSNERFHLIYAGALYGRRKPDHVLQALHNLIVDGRIQKEKVSIEFIGNIHAHVMTALKERFQLESVLFTTGYMAHDALLKHMGHANLLVLIESEKNFYTGKVFEYIKLGVPILATVPPDGAAAQVITETETGDVIPVEDVPGIEALILERYQQWQKSELNYQPSYQAIERYGRKAQAQALAKCFDNA